MRTFVHTLDVTDKDHDHDYDDSDDYDGTIADRPFANNKGDESVK